MKLEVIAMMLFGVVGGLGIFLLGMKYMSDGLQTVAGSRLRSLISAVTNNRLVALGVGTGVTCLVQSSSVTTVMVVGFVNAGFMTLSQAIGVIMGANIGTTITGWILALKIGKYGLPVLGISALLYRFVKKERLRYVAMVAMGIGMVFFGLELMKNGFKPLRDAPDFERWFHLFRADSYFGVLKCAMVGCVLTLIVQSSSATLGITIGLATTGVIPFETAAALVLGENIGTTITAYLASLGATTNAKRAAWAHIIFNVVGVLWITALFHQYLWVLRRLLHFDPSFKEVVDGVPNYPYVTAAIAAVHTGFNVMNTVLFLPFSRRLAGLLMRLMPDPAYREEPHLTQLDGRMLSSPVIGMEQCRRELVRMGDMNRKALFRLRQVLSSEPIDDGAVKKVFHREEVLDIMQKEMTVFLTELLSSSVTHEVADEARRMLRMADEYESVSDYVVKILKLYLRLREAGQDLLPKDRQSILDLHDQVAEYMDMINDACAQNHPEIVSKAHVHGDGITHHIRELRGDHLAEVSHERQDPLVTVIFIDMLNGYRRVKDHGMNVAESLAGQK
ncbi:MAG TPA: Na/Pi cotransporter family protein [Phycisphaerae bacterium]|nr:Na/Pi cotransporter family protein [Phycisphaerae bacterium]